MAEEEGAPVREGDVLAGKYRVERVLGVGGMGVVVAATHLQLDQRVALKFLLPRAMESGEVVARFAREARAAAKIQSEHVARVIDVGTMPETGSPFMVMEYLEGADLADTLRQTGPLPIERAVGYVLEACEALAEAHAAGIVHRDLKPANLFLAKRPGRGEIVKVLDFGISKMTSATTNDAALTKTATLMGSPLYMSPEQLMSAKHVDARSDIWAIGVILHELLSGSPPFTGETVPQIVTSILHVPHAPLTTLRADAPRGLEDVVTRCLAKDPSARFASVADLAAALAPFASARAASTSVERIERVLGRAAPVEPKLTSSSAAVTAPTMSMTDGSWTEGTAGVPKRGSALGLLAAAIVGVAAIGAGAWFLFVRTEPRAPASQAKESVEKTDEKTKSNEKPSSEENPPPPPTAATPTAPTIAESSTKPGVPTISKPLVGTKPTIAKSASAAIAVSAPPPPPTTPPPPPPATTKKNPLDMDLK